MQDKFNYPDISSETIEGMRIYVVPPASYYPSITTVLGHTMPQQKRDSLEQWKKSIGEQRAREISETATTNGTAVHLLAERYVKKQPIIETGEVFNDHVIKLFNALKTKLNKIQEVWGQEVALFSNKIGVAGRCDCIAYYKGKPSIIDYKTSSKIKDKNDIEDYYLQLCAYAIMHNEMFGTDITQGVVLMTSDGGFPQEFLVDLNDYVSPLQQRVELFYRQWLR